MRKILPVLWLALFLIGGCTKNSPFENTQYQLIQNNSLLKITLAFDKDGKHFSGKVFNVYAGTYDVAGSKLVLHLTDKGQANGHYDMMAVEQDYFLQLEKVISYKYSQTSLTLYTSDNYALEFEKIGPSTAE